jgi:ATP-dependent Zn protease
MFGASKKDAPPGVADPDVLFGECVLVFTSSQGEAAYDLPLYNDRRRMSVNERTSMLLDVLRGKEGTDRALVPALLNALAESVVLPFCRLDTPALLQIAKARLRDAAERWRNQHKVALRIELFETMAELFLLSQGGRVSPRTLTIRAAENFLFSWVEKSKSRRPGGRIVLVPEMEMPGAYPFVRQSLGDDPVLTLFRKHQCIAFALQVDATADVTRVRFGDFRLETIRRAGDYTGQGSLQVEMPAVCFDDVVGHTESKSRLRQIIRMLGQKDELASFGIGVPRGMMLYGPPGTGKTMLAKAFSHEADLPFVAVTGTELMDIEFIRKLFLRLRRYAPAVLFIDEIDAIGRRGQSVVGDAIINQLLAEIDGFSSDLDAPLFVIAATNYPEKLDAALLRSGRLDLHVEVPTLDEEARRQFLDRYRTIPGLAEFDVERALTASSKLSGADLEKARREIVLEMARSERACADEALLFSKLAEIKHGEMRDVECSDGELERNAFHEAGHAVIAQLLLPEQSIERVSIEIRGEAVGGVSFVGGKPRVDNLDAVLVRKRLCMMLAGRMAEMKRFGEAGCNAGAASDLRQATELAGRAVMCWGLDKSVGLLSFTTTDGALPALGSTPDWAVERIRAWLDQAALDIDPLLDQHWGWVEGVAKALLERKTLGLGELAELRIRSTCSLSL